MEASCENQQEQGRHCQNHGQRGPQADPGREPIRAHEVTDKESQCGGRHGQDSPLDCDVTIPTTSTPPHRPPKMAHSPTRRRSMNRIRGP